MRILVTGAAGFIGCFVSRELLMAGHTVIGLDNCNDYYDVNLKKARLDLLKPYPTFSFRLGDVADAMNVMRLFADSGFDVVVHLAAQAGVRYSLENPESYIRANLLGFSGILEACRQFPVKHLVYASSSSVYGLNTHLPFNEDDPTNHPASLYAATKKSNELLAHSYSHLFHIPVTGLRFFTVYGPWGRPDMAPFIFTKAILEGKPIHIFNHGQMRRDFTYIDDIVAGVVSVVDHIPAPDPAWDSSAPKPSSSSAPYAVYNIGNHEPVELGHFINLLEQAIGKKAIKEYLPMQPGDVQATYADTAALRQAVGFLPTTPVEIGVPKFVSWFLDFYRA